MNELKYSGLTVASITGVICALSFDNLMFAFAGVVIGLLYEIINN